MHRDVQIHNPKIINVVSKDNYLQIFFQSEDKIYQAFLDINDNLLKDLKSYIKSSNKNIFKKIFSKDKFDNKVNLYGCYKFADFDFYLDKTNNLNSFIFSPNENIYLTIHMNNTNMQKLISIIIKYSDI